MPARRRPPGVRLGLDRRSGPVGSAFLVDVADDILAIDCDSADRVEVVQEIATELQGHGYRPFGLLPVGPVTNKWLSRRHRRRAFRLGDEKLKLPDAAKRASETLRHLVHHFLPSVKQAPYKKREFWERAYFGLRW